MRRIILLTLTIALIIFFIVWGADFYLGDTEEEGSDTTPPNTVLERTEQREKKLRQEQEERQKKEQAERKRAIVIPTSPAGDGAPPPVVVVEEKVLTPEEEQFVESTDDWIQEVTLLMKHIDDLYKDRIRGRAGGDAVLQAQFKKVQNLTNALSVSPEFSDASEAITSFSTVLAESMEELSSPSTAEELEIVLKKTSTLSDEINIINRVRNQARY